MYNKKDILKILNEYNYFIDEQVLSSFIKNWKIDPIYEDEDGVEFFDNLSIAKIKKGISLKSQGYDAEKIIHYTNKILTDQPKQEEAKPAEGTMTLNSIVPTSPTGELKNFTVDVTNQTLQLLADALASKITAEIKEQIQASIANQPLIQDANLKQDNESLSQKVQDLLDDNKKLAQRIEELENKKKSFLTWLKDKIFIK